MQERDERPPVPQQRWGADPSMTGAATRENSRQLGSPVGNRGELDAFFLIRHIVLKGHRKDVLKLILKITAVGASLWEEKEVRDSGLEGWGTVRVCGRERAQLSQTMSQSICIVTYRFYSNGFSD